MNPLDPMTVPLEKRLLIEASAGTGKTYTISLLYLRLLLDQSLTVDQILVVTYTHAATDELRSRILLRLKEAVAAYEQPETASAEYLRLLEQYPSDAERLLILKRALLNFDEAAIYTIHSFCQRALKENAFDVGMPFESELISDEQELLISLADNFWHRYLLHPDPLQEAVIRHRGCTPDDLLAVVKPYIGRPYLDRQPKGLLTAQEYVQRQTLLVNQWQTINKQWQQEGNQALQLIIQAISTETLSKTQYKSVEAIYNAEAILLKVFQGERPEGWANACNLFTSTKLVQGTKKNKITPEHTLFKQIEQAILEDLELADALDKGFDQLCYDLMLFLREKLPQRKTALGVLAFDDLLVNLQQALCERPVLAQQLVQDYPVALIDEFQDTDPIQYEVFSRIYEKKGILVFVGDPKQAIYAFRGADIHTYLRAAHDIDQSYHYTLDRNFRSTPALLDAFNYFFSRSQDPFRNELSVAYETVQAGKSNLIFQAPQLHAPLRFWTWEKQDQETESKNKYSARQLEQLIAKAVASDIAQLLMAARKGEVLIGEGEPKALQSRDIAILVRSHKQGKLMSEALQAHHIASSQRSKEPIFATPEAHELRLLLEAIVEPTHEAKLRQALTTELMGGTVQTLLDLELSKESDNRLLEGWIEQFTRWHLLWVKQGFMVMFQDWLQSPNLLAPDLTQQQHLLSFINGERRLTNLWHLAELLYNELRQGAKSMQALVRWLVECSEYSGNEDSELRLESDEALVQIVTIHKSKGLQYPVVYCPFLWSEANSPAHYWFNYYDIATGKTSLFASRFKDNERDNAYACFKKEAQQESLRLIYVALTRAIYHCSIALPIGKLDGFNYDTALYWLLYGHLPQSEALLSTASSEVAKKAKITPEDRTQIFKQALLDLVEVSQNTMSCEPLPPVVDELKLSSMQETLLKPIRYFKATPAKTKRVDSFSSLSSGNHYETPDYDSDWGSTPSISTDYNQFPAGKLAGVCLHKLFEELDFKLSLEAQTEQIKSTLLAYGFDERYYPAAVQLIDNTLNTPLKANTELKLINIAQEQRLDELEFYFPIEYLSVKKLQQTLERYTPASKIAQHQAIKRLKFQEVQGFMKGFIDLVFEYKGRYYIIDYKSNRLANTPEEYTKERMEEAVAEAHYYLQYLIYCVALQRYLTVRLPSYSYDTHFGGVFYLFMRGMQPTEAGGNGIYATRPKEDFINALDALMN
ncbi:MAG: exodeoxyribonuclease V subunit beta [Thiofilum sp.]|uniref:exodeoxyribonuclease V subunit beta n=1 Tax=Thiofilum sp. TaxID=2212733 RepID=UPI0025E0415E|nr:exodeoxyribonuclease V subunit beta [Thiofilum sp.]MBK8453744.1 exodeoxyribonuclease V subunit beta [Thiofilum sp.]